ncbi:MAG: primosomal protein N', partial [Nocardioidaceae bacterium]
SMHDDVVPGCRVTVRFAGKQTSGFVLERVESSDHTGRLGRIARVVSSEVVLRPDVVPVVRSVADRYAGTFADVVRLAVPPRHARTEKRTPAPPEPGPLPAPASGVWDTYDGGRAMVDALAGGGSPRACWAAVPAHDPENALAEAVRATVQSGRGAVVCVPDTADVERMDTALTRALGSGRHVKLTADLGPAARYAAFLALARGHVNVVVGTRAAAFAPVRDLGLVAIWDDGDDLFAEPRAPYPHTREVLLTRALDAGCAVLVGGYARTCEAQQLVESGWCADVAPASVPRRAGWAKVQVAGSDDTARDGAAARSRLPHEVFGAVREALATGPVLVQVPRLGYRSALACQHCRSPARCADCSGPLQQQGPDAVPSCGWCGHLAQAWACPECGGRTLRSPLVGERRTAEEIGRAFPMTPVRTSSGGSVLHTVGADPAIVVATPGAEPVAAGGFAAAILMDTRVMLGRPDLRTAEESLRRWLNAAAKVRPAGQGGRVLAVGDAGLPVVQALVRADPVGHARRELAERQDTRFPPAVRLATVEGPSEAVRAAAGLDWPGPVDVLGPVPVEQTTGDTAETSRLIVRVPRRQGPALSRRLAQLHADRSTRKQPHLRVRVDPAAIS